MRGRSPPTRAARTARFSLTCYVAAGFAKYGLQAAAKAGFGALLVAVLAVEILSAPVNVLADACAIAASPRGAGDYGKTRLWGAIGWGLGAPLGGWAVGAYGLPAAFAGSAAGWAVGGLFAVALPMGAIAGAGGGERAVPASPPPPLVSAAEAVSFDAHAIKEEAGASSGVEAGAGAALDAPLCARARPPPRAASPPRSPPPTPSSSWPPPPILGPPWGASTRGSLSC